MGRILLASTRSGGLFLLLACGLAWGCDSGGEEIAADPTASLSGIVRDAYTEAPLAGIELRISGREITSGADGSYAFEGIDVGWVTLEATAPRYASYSQLLSLQAGSNSHNVSLDPQTLYHVEVNSLEGFTLYLPPGAASFRGILFVVAGAGGESRAFVRGQFEADPSIAAFQEEMYQNFLALAERYDLAILGEDSRGFDHSRRTGERAAEAISQLAVDTGYPELAAAPLLFWGYSAGGCFSYSVAQEFPERVIGFVTQKGGCHSEGDHGPGKLVPGYLFIGEGDTFARIENISEAFGINRAAGALWALGLDPGAGHEPVEVGGAADVVDRWMDVVLTQRLPATPGAELQSIAEGSGWLGDNTTFGIGSFECFTGDRSAASWLPTRETAEDWQSLSSDGRVTSVMSC